MRNPLVTESAPSANGGSWSPQKMRSRTRFFAPSDIPTRERAVNGRAASRPFGVIGGSMFEGG